MQVFFEVVSDDDGVLLPLFAVLPLLKVLKSVTEQAVAAGLSPSDLINLGGKEYEEQVNKDHLVSSIVQGHHDGQI